MIEYIEPTNELEKTICNAFLKQTREGEITEGGRGIKIFTEVMDEYSYKRGEDTNEFLMNKTNKNMSN